MNDGKPVWQPIETAPKNSYGERYGPVVLVWCNADDYPWPAFYDPCYEWKDFAPGPAWVIPDQDPPIHPTNATHWMPLPEPPEEA